VYEKNLVILVILSNAKMENTGCLIMTFFEKTNPILRVIGLKTYIWEKNKPKTNPIQTQFFIRYRRILLLN